MKLTFFSRISLILLAAASLASCEKEDKLITLPPPGNAILASLSMGENYENQFYYDLASQQFASSRYDIWDLAMSTTGKPFIQVNGGEEILVYRTGSTDFNQTYTVSGSQDWKWDNPNGHPDSTAFGELNDSQQVYLVDLGPNTPVNRYRKMQVTSVNSQSYQLKYANLDGKDSVRMSVGRDTTRNFVYMSFDGSGKVVTPEPDKNTWDILFTKYRHVFYDMTPVTPYQVTGVLLNPNNVAVYKETQMKFEDVTYEAVASKTFSVDRNIIGYDWKVYDFNTSSYVVNSKITFVIRNTQGVYYKLRFLDFYDDFGVKGTPKFELQRL